MNIGYPFECGDKPSGRSVAGFLFELNEDGRGGRRVGGYFPVGANSLWHGGVHLVSAERVLCITSGHIVAWRMNEAPLRATVKGEVREFSTGFVLVRHDASTPAGTPMKFYSLSMHLLPWQTYHARPELEPPVYSREMKPKKVITEAHGSGVRILSDAPAAAVLGLIPRKALFEVLEAPAPANLPAGYAKVRYGDVEGFAQIQRRSRDGEWRATANIILKDARGRQLEVIRAGDLFETTDERIADRANVHVRHGTNRGVADIGGKAVVVRQRLTGGDDRPANPAQMGLEVLAHGDDDAAFVRILPRGTLIHFKDPDAVSFPKPHHPAQYFELADGGFVKVDQQNLEEGYVIKKPPFDVTQRPAQPLAVERGDPLGYPGTYLRVVDPAAPAAPAAALGNDNLIHFEIFHGEEALPAASAEPSIAFMENPHNEHWFERTYEVAAGTTFMKKEPLAEADNPKTRVELPEGSFVRVFDAPTGSDYVGIYRLEVIGWKPRAELGELHEHENSYLLGSSIEPLLAEKPTDWCDEESKAKAHLGTVEGMYLDVVDRVTLAEDHWHVEYLGKKAGPGKTKGWARKCHLGDFFPRAYLVERAPALALKNAPASCADILDATAATTAALPALPLWVGRQAEGDEVKIAAEKLRKVKWEGNTGWARLSALGPIDAATGKFKAVKPISLFAAVPESFSTAHAAKVVPKDALLENLVEEGTIPEEVWGGVSYRTGADMTTSWVPVKALGDAVADCFVLSAALPGLLKEEPKSYADIKMANDREKAQPAVAGKAGDALRRLEAMPAQPRTEFLKVRVHGGDKEGWKCIEVLKKNGHDPSAHYRLPRNLNTLLKAEPARVDLAIGAELSIVERATIGGVDLARFRKAPPHPVEGWWLENGLGTVQPDGSRKLTQPLPFALAGKPTVLNVSGRAGDLVLAGCHDIVGGVSREVGRGALAQITMVITEPDEVCRGWVPRNALPRGLAPPFVGCYRTTREVAEVLAYCPDRTFKFDTPEGSNHGAFTFDEPPERVRDVDGHVWGLVEFGPGRDGARGPSGWIDLHRDPATRSFVNRNLKANSAYNWAYRRGKQNPGRPEERDRWQEWETWRLIHEQVSSENPLYEDDMICDRGELLELLETKPEGQPREQRNEVVTDQELDASMTEKQRIARRFRMLACLHPSEWHIGTADEENKRWKNRLMGERFGLSKATYDETMAYVRKLEFWSSVPELKDLPKKSRVWNLHPISMISNLRRQKAVDPEQIATIMRAGSWRARDNPSDLKRRIERFLPWLCVAMEKYEINTTLRQAHFLAQLAVESDGLFASLEYASGEEYQWKEDHRSWRPNDGVNFKGRGLIQLTGRLNYTRYGAHCMRRFADTADQRALLEQDEFACDVAGWYWRHPTRLEDINSIIELGRYRLPRDPYERARSVRYSVVRAVTVAINGGLTDIAKRTAAFEIAVHVLFDSEDVEAVIRENKECAAFP